MLKRNFPFVNTSFGEKLPGVMSPDCAVGVGSRLLGRQGSCFVGALGQTMFESTEHERFLGQKFMGVLSLERARSSAAVASMLKRNFPFVNASIGKKLAGVMSPDGAVGVGSRLLGRRGSRLVGALGHMMSDLTEHERSFWQILTGVSSLEGERSSAEVSSMLKRSFPFVKTSFDKKLTGVISPDGAIGVGSRLLGRRGSCFVGALGHMMFELMEHERSLGQRLAGVLSPRGASSSAEVSSMLKRNFPFVNTSFGKKLAGVMSPDSAFGVGSRLLARRGSCFVGALGLMMSKLTEHARSLAHMLV